MNSTHSTWSPTIHDVINARTTRGNASWMTWDGTMRFGAGNHGRYLQSAVHTYEALGLARRTTYRVVEPACHVVHHPSTASFLREVIRKRKLIMTDLDTKIAAWKTSEKERTPGEWMASTDSQLSWWQVWRGEGEEEILTAETQHDAAHICNAVNLVPELVAEVERLRHINEQIRMQAEIHSMEARTANSSLNECYQAVTGATGEPGTWNGAEPVRAMASENEALRARVAELEDILFRSSRPARAQVEPEDVE